MAENINQLGKKYITFRGVKTLVLKLGKAGNFGVDIVDFVQRSLKITKSEGKRRIYNDDLVEMTITYEE